MITNVSLDKVKSVAEAEPDAEKTIFAGLYGDRSLDN